MGLWLVNLAGWTLIVLSPESNVGSEHGSSKFSQIPNSYFFPLNSFPESSRQDNNCGFTHPKYQKKQIKKHINFIELYNS